MRTWSPYEFNLLTKFGFDPFALAKTVDPNIPVEYITGKVEFRNLVFDVNSHVLIPRVETEEIVKIAVKESLLDPPFIKGGKGGFLFADIGTGSGAIGISIAKELLNRGIRFFGILSDISKEALSIAEKNAINILENNVEVIDGVSSLKSQVSCLGKCTLLCTKSDLLSPYLKDQPLDLIVANLPYIPSSRIKDLDSSVKDFEPRLALDGGEDGLVYIRKLLQQSKNYLKEDGIIILEVDDTHDENVTKEFQNEWRIEVRKDQNEKVRFWIIHLRTA